MRRKVMTKKETVKIVPNNPTRKNNLFRRVDIAITSLTLSSMCSCTWLQSSPPPPPPPPWLRACCYSSTQHSVLKTLTHIHSSGVIACLRANRAGTESCTCCT
nr:hypothetical protein CFP56_14362 [Quercus suber]